MANKEAKKAVKKEFRVKVREVHVQDYVVEANTEKEAIELVAKGNGAAVDNTLEYSHMADADGCPACGIGKWEVKEE